MTKTTIVSRIAIVGVIAGVLVGVLGHSLQPGPDPRSEKKPDARALSYAKENVELTEVRFVRDPDPPSEEGSDDSGNVLVAECTVRNTGDRAIASLACRAAMPVGNIQTLLEDAERSADPNARRAEEVVEVLKDGRVLRPQGGTATFLVRFRLAPGHHAVSGPWALAMMGHHFAEVTVEPVGAEFSR